MPTRRSMLKWIPAACFAAWCGLRPAAAALPAAPAQAASPPSGEDISSDYDSFHHGGSNSSWNSYTYNYDADGRLLSIRYSDYETTYYEYAALDSAASAAT
jgi:YD repeat-containing protein